jgi:hypothetical protein
VTLGSVRGAGALGFAAFHHPLENCTFAEILDLFQTSSEFQEALRVAFQGGIPLFGSGNSGNEGKRNLIDGTVLAGTDSGGWNRHVGPVVERNQRQSDPHPAKQSGPSLWRRVESQWEDTCVRQR